MPNSPDISLPPRLSWLDGAKGLAIVGVVLLHVVRWLEPLGVRSGVADVMVGMASPLPVFFLVSGLVGGRLLQSRDLRLVVRKRVVPLLWVFTVWQPVVFLYKMLAAGTLPDQEDTSLAAHLFRLVISPVRPNGELWFLWALALYSILTPTILRLPERSRLIAVAAVGVAWSVTTHALISDSGYRLLGPGWQDLGTFYAFFVVGVSCRDRIVVAVGRLTPKRALVVVAVWQAAFWLLRGVGPLDGAIANALATAAGLIVALLGCCAVIAMSKWVCRIRLFAGLGRQTLPVFLIHTSLTVSTACALHVIGLPPPPQVGASVATAIVLAFAVVILASSCGLGCALGSGPGRVLFAPPARFTALVKF